MLQGSKLGREPLHLLNDLASFYPVKLAQFLTGGNTQATNRLKSELKKYTAPAILILDELGFLPVDKLGADLLFQVFSQRYERGSIVITSNRAYKDWPGIFNNDSTLASAILDRLLHHAQTVIIAGKSYRMKEHLD